VGKAPLCIPTSTVANLKGGYKRTSSLCLGGGLDRLDDSLAMFSMNNLYLLVLITPPFATAVVKFVR
jgi:hypothetical protein